MTRNLKTRIRRLENWTDKRRFTVPEDGLSEIDQTIATALIEIIEKRFAENGDHRVAMVLCTEVLERAQQINEMYYVNGGGHTGPALRDTFDISNNGNLLDEVGTGLSLGGGLALFGAGTAFTIGAPALLGLGLTAFGVAGLAAGGAALLAS